MNLSHFNQLLAYFEAGAPHIVFDMNHGVLVKENWEEYTDKPVPRSCGAIACIAGAASLMATRTLGLKGIKKEKLPSGEDSWMDTRDTALRWLDLPAVAVTDRYRSSNFYGHPLFQPLYGYEDPTAAQAAQAIRNTMETGDPQWKTFLKKRVNDYED